MRELDYVARRTLEWREAPDPRLESDLAAIVAPVTATTCDVDSMLIAGQGFIEPPFAIGHECVARVVEVGDAVGARREQQLSWWRWQRTRHPDFQTLPWHDRPSSNHRHSER